MSKHRHRSVRSIEFSIQDWRTRMGYTQVQAAHVLGVGERTLTYYEQRERIRWPVYLACRFVEAHRREAERMAAEYDGQTN